MQLIWLTVYFISKFLFSFANISSLPLHGPFGHPTVPRTHGIQQQYLLQCVTSSLHLMYLVFFSFPVMISHAYPHVHLFLVCWCAFLLHSTGSRCLRSAFYMMSDVPTTPSSLHAGKISLFMVRVSQCDCGCCGRLLCLLEFGELSLVVSGSAMHPGLASNSVGDQG